MAIPLDLRQSVLRNSLNMAGTSANAGADTIANASDALASKLFTDRNAVLTDGGIITVNSSATSISFSQNLNLVLNQNLAGASPIVISLGSATQTLVNGTIIYATINRSLGTATITSATTMPSVSAINQEIFLIFKREDSADGTPRVYFRDGQVIGANQAVRLGDTSQFLKKTGDTMTGNLILNAELGLTESIDSSTTGTNATLTALTTSYVKLTNGSLGSVSTIPAGISGQILVLKNGTGNAVIINNGANLVTGTGGNVNLANGATLQFIYDSNGTAWNIVGGTGSGSGGTGKNYLSTYNNNPGNGDFELGTTTGWSLFNTTITTANGYPLPNGTINAGASSITTYTVVSVGQLAGKYSLEIGSSGAITAGQGIISDAFTIDSEDQAKILAEKFYYKVLTGLANLNLSGTSANTWGVYMYDVTNTAWIQLNGSYGITVGSGSGKYSGSFQTSFTASQYRLAVICINASAGASSMLFDDFSVGPQSDTQGAAITDWTAYTLVIGSTASAPTPGTVTVNNARWRRVGDSMEIKYDFSQSSAGSAGSGNYLFPIPTGYSIDLTKFVNSGAVSAGSAFITNTGSSENGGGVVIVNDSTNFLISTTSSAIGNGRITSVSSAFFQLSNATISYSFTALVPIQGWSSNVQMSSDTDTRVVVARGTQDSHQLIGVFTQLIFNNTAYDSHGGIQNPTTAWSYTAPVAGYYQVSGAIASDNAAWVAGATFELYVYKNGSPFANLATITAETSSVETLGASGSTIVQLNAGDAVTMVGNTNRAGGVTIAASDVYNWVSISRLSGPATVAATESVYAKAYLSANDSYTANAPVIFDTKVKDTHNSYNPNTGLFTCPVSGTYMVMTSLQNQSGTSCSGYVIKNGVVNALYLGGSLGVNTFVNGSTIIPCLAGDTLAIAVDASITISGSASQVSSFSVVRVGN